MANSHKAQTVMKAKVIAVGAALLMSTGAVIGGLVASQAGVGAHAPTPNAGGAVIDGIATEPVGKVSDQYLNKPYVAPAGSVSRKGAGGRLSIPSLRIRAPVAVTKLANGVMAIPNDPRQVGWLDRTSARNEVIGSSVIAGHVSNDANVPGALWNLGKVRKGQRIIWTSPQGKKTAFVVTGIHQYSRSRGLPGWVFSTTGPHVLNLITCAHRVVYPDGRWHYTNNLVVTARAIN